MENNQFELDLSEFKIIWVGTLPIIIPQYLSITQEKYLIASQLTLLLQNSSVDRTLKYRLHDFEKNRSINKNSKSFELLDRTLTFTKKQNQDIYERLKKLVFEPETLSVVACDSVFLRLEASYRSIHYHLKFGYYFESFLIIRFVLEQLAYAYTCSTLQTGNIEKLVDPSRSIKQLKQFIPEVGSIYGSLSKFSHLDVSKIKKFLVIHEEKVYSVTHSIFFALEASLYYLQILKYRNFIFEYCFRNYIDNFVFIGIKDGRYFPKKEYPGKVIYSKFEEHIKNYLTKIDIKGEMFRDLSEIY